MRDHRWNILLWTAYAAAFLIAYFFAAGIFARFPLFGSVPNLVPVAIAFVAVLEGSFGGSVYGLCLGLFACLAQGGRGASLIFLGAVTGMLAGFWQERRLRRTLGPCLTSAFLALVGVNAVQILLRLLFGQGGSLPTLLRIAGLETAYSMLLALPLYPLFRFVHRRFGNS